MEDWSMKSKQNDPQTDVMKQCASSINTTEIAKISDLIQFVKETKKEENSLFFANPEL